MAIGPGVGSGRFGVNREQEQNGSIVTNSQPQIESRIAKGRITWIGPVLLLTGRSALMLAAQADVGGASVRRSDLTPFRGIQRLGAPPRRGGAFTGH